MCVYVSVCVHAHTSVYAHLDTHVCAGVHVYMFKANFLPTVLGFLSLVGSLSMHTALCLTHQWISWPYWLPSTGHNQHLPCSAVQHKNSSRGVHLQAGFQQQSFYKVRVSSLGEGCHGQMEGLWLLCPAVSNADLVWW